MKKKPNSAADPAEVRSRAEDRLSEQQKSQRSEAGDQRAAEDTARLVHELEVHQIELEMQNEELQQARGQAETLLAQYTDLYDFVPTGYFNLDREGAIRQVNLTGARLLGVERSRLMNRRFGLFVAEDFRSAFNAFLQKVFSIHAKKCCEVALLNEGRRPLFVRIESVISEDGHECLAMVMDLTERWQAEEQARAAHAETQRLLALSDQSRRALLNAVEDEKRAAEALRESEERFRKVFEEGPLGMVMASVTDGRFIKTNATFCQMMGYTEEELNCLTFVDVTHPEHRPADAEAVNTLWAGQTPQYKTEKRYLKKNGEILWGTLTASLILGEDAKPLYSLAMIEDITERKRAEEEIARTTEQLRALSAHLQRIREEERTLIAREIHDELGQALTALKMDMASITALAAKNRSVKEKAASMSQLMDDTIQTVRRIASDLRPGILDDLGIVAALQWQTQEFHKRTGMQCDFICELDSIPLPKDHSTTLFRICQESLTNVTRHAKPRRHR